MKLSHTILAVSLALLAAPAATVAGPPGAAPASPTQTGALPVPANRIVGLWATEVTIGPCQGGPTMTIHGTSLFHAGGTMGETNTSAPSGRSHSQGIWKFVGWNQYKTRFRFYVFLPDGSYDGVQEIRTTTVLNSQATQYDATVNARFLNPDGSLRFQVCGSARGDRIGFD